MLTKKRKRTTKTEPVNKKAPGLVNKWSSGIGVDVGLLSSCFGDRTRTKLLVMCY